MNASSIRFLLAALALPSGGLLAPAMAQAPPAAADERLSVDHLREDERYKLQELRDGKRMYNAGDRALLDKAARWYIYRLTWKQYQERVPLDGVTLSTGRSLYDILQTDLYPMLLLPDPKRPSTLHLSDEQQRYMQEFGNHLVTAIQAVLKNPKPIARVNAAMVLARLGETGKENLAEPLLAVLNDSNQIDAVRFWAVVGLKHVLAGDPMLEKESRAFINKALQQQVIQGLIEFLKRKPTYATEASPGEVQAFHYLRREAIRALGESRLPGTERNKNMQKFIDAPTAYELMRVVCKDGVDPEPNMSERVEAALSLSRLQSRYCRAYDVEYAAHLIGRFFVEFAEIYEAERLKPQRTEPWKYYGALLQQAAENLQSDWKTDPKVGPMLQLSRSVFKDIAAGSQASELRNLRGWIQNNPPAQRQLYQGVAGLDVKYPEPKAAD